MTDLRKAAQQALEALESGLAFDTNSDVLQNLRTALEQQAEPVFENLDYVAVVYSPSNAMLKSPLPIGTHLYKYPPQRKPLTDELYNELLFAVGSKYPDETRHQTALRYIKRAEMRSASPAKAAHNIKEEM